MTVEAEELYGILRDWIGASTGPPSTGRDPVNQPMIRHWCDAMGDDNPIYTDPDAAAAGRHGGIVAPPTMLQAWNMQGLRRVRPERGGQDELMAILDGAGYTSVVATNCDQEYVRYLRPGDLLTEDGVIEDVSPLKRTALGDGHFVTTLRTYRDQDGEIVATMRFRLLKFRPRPVSVPAGTPPAGSPPPEPPTAGSPSPEPPKAGSRPWPHPAISRDTAFFWAGTADHQLRIQRCAACATLRHPPGPSCAACGSLEWDHQIARGRGTIYSFVVHHHPPVPPFETPFVVAVVELEEGTRIVGNVLDVEPADVRIGLAVRVRFEQVAEDLVLPQWELDR
ncbi:MAG TPA: OB-fold domain-containing protein [Acidimicrobiales bacterium]|nr:OB-fold domain-containing protein [Acidimicrobiales bacterium]